MKRSGLLLAMLLAFAPATVHADSNTGLQGRVYRENGQPAAQATIEAIAPSGRYSTVTGADGRFVMFGLENDVYTINADSGRERGYVYRAIVAPDESEYVVIPLSHFCPMYGYSVRGGSSYLLEARHQDDSGSRCL